MQSRALIGLIGAFCACRGDRPAEGPDPHSFALPGRIAVRHLDLDLTVDFGAKQLAGTAKLTLARTAGATLVLDDSALVIEDVADCAGNKLAHAVGRKEKIGAPLTVEVGKADCVAIRYRTSPDAGALLWVEPSGTAGGKQPMLFTQSQAINARSWIPIQDSPGVRFTYEATIRPPQGMWAVMSAPNPQAPPADGVWRFKQEHPIPAYLMALAVGDFAFRATGPRSGVYAEPSVVDAAAFEFAEVEQMIDAAEKLYGPYRWGRYDMLVLPPSFPFGGMENPNLSFLTPTVLTGDRALVSLIAHELAHSWSGNLATNSTWNDTWLNEGFTTYVEARIMEQLRGREYADVMWNGSRKTVDKAIAEHGRGPPTRLAHHYTRGTDVDEIPTSLSYDKGALFLRTLEVAHGRDAFDAWLKGWFDRHAFQSVDSRMFEREIKTLGDKVAVAKWLYEGGLPADVAPTPSSHVDAIEKLAAQKTLPDAAQWTTVDWVIYLKAIPKDASLDWLKSLDDKYKLTATTNAEIAMHWLPVLVRADGRLAAPAVEAFLSKVGRVRMIRPLYTAMMEGADFWRALAKTTFDQTKPRYHPITREVIGRIVK